MLHTFRQATYADCDAIMSMYDHSRQLMRASGNHEQWMGYPTLADLQADIAAGHSVLLMHHECPIATFALVPGTDPHYAFIENGQWFDPNSPYATLHRIAKAPDMGDNPLPIADLIIDYAKSHHSHLRIDTHPTNLAMRHIAAKHDFLHCGTVYMDDHTPRLAYEWQRFDEVSPAVRLEIDTHVLPLYEAFDPAHRRNHALRVIARTMVLWRQLSAEADVRSIGSANAIYVAAACHDVGLAQGRDHHHTASADFIRHHAAFKNLLTDDEIALAAQAAADHRASAAEPPHSLAGCVLAEADRDITSITIVQRTVAYGLEHYPHLDREAHFQRTLQHLNEKYSANGYLRLWLTPSPNDQPLADLRTLIADTPRLRHLFDKLFDSMTTPSDDPNFQ